MKIAIMQPYFIPYAGYFRLLLNADLFVIYNCVQFPRRSFVHRNQLKRDDGVLDWLTLPLEKAPQTALIEDLKFRADAVETWASLSRKFPAYRACQKLYPELFQTLNAFHLDPVSYLVATLREVCRILDIPFNIHYSAQLNLPSMLKGQDRILAIAKYFHATDYINAPGGRALYQEDIFKLHGLRLHFLSNYEGAYHSVLQTLMDNPAAYVRDHIQASKL